MSAAPAGDAAIRFRALHERGGIFVMPNPWDAGTAKVLEHFGFEAIATASAALACSLGRADASGAVSRQQALDHARVLIGAVDLPVNGDLESGFGDEPEDVAETIRQSIAVGMAGCSIEDRTCDSAHPLYVRGLAIERIRAARTVIDDAGSRFVLTARCEAYLTGHDDPLGECLDRLAAMADAGADVVYACGMREPDHIAELVKTVPVPVNVIGGTGPAPLSIGQLEDLGVRRVSLGPRLCQAAMGAFVRAAEEVSGKGTFGFMKDAGNLAAVTAMFGFRG
ncbi:MAG TPA: isocitrate lyase/phosphoenolpyruvate mutase family protein [Afifellaceae bacterium]|nr:isocitrate lyase/phosphoenolpyruvate mutase family protein [Afifellaceae bacterium]